MQITAVLKTTVIAAKPTRVLVKARSPRPKPNQTLNLAFRLGVGAGTAKTLKAATAHI